MENIYNKTMAFFNMTDFSHAYFTMALHCWVIFIIALPVVCLAIYGLISQIRTDHVVPVYVINLLISDVLLICTKPIALTLEPAGITYELLFFIYSIGLQASTVFMVCIAAERYAMIAHPLWYRFQRTRSKSILCSLAAWMATFVSVSTTVVSSVTEVIDIGTLFVTISVLNLLPYPFVTFFFVGSWRALSKSMSVSSHEKQRIMGTLALVLFIYTVFFLPYIVMAFVLCTSPRLLRDTIFQNLAVLTSTLLSLNPLFDPILYVFVTKKRLFILPCFHCRPCRRHEQQEQGETEFSPPQSVTIDSGEADI